MLKPKLNRGALKLLILFHGCLFGSLVEAGAKVENSFQNSQYSQYSEYYSPTPNSQYQDLTKSVPSGEISNSPVQGDPLVAQSSVHVQQPASTQGTPNQHVYYYETYPMQDPSSRGNGYGAQGNKHCKYTGNGNMRCYSRQDDDFDNTDDFGGGGDGAGLGGLAGLIGLLGLKGVKGLTSVLFPAIFPLLFPLAIPLLLPILLPLLLPLLILPLLLLLLIPVPVISIPPAGRSLEVGFAEARKIATNAFDRVVSSDECVERISCEISRMSKGRKAGEWLGKVLGLLPEKSLLTKRIHKGFATYNATIDRVDDQTCSKLKCKMFNVFEASG